MLILNYRNLYEIILENNLNMILIRFAHEFLLIQYLYFQKMKIKFFDERGLAK